jgi:4-carboxymuconolactone decarboxylase
MRFKELNQEEMSEAQRTVYRSIAEGPRGGVRGPFNALLRCPELADRAQKLGEYIRFGSTLPQRLMEFAIIITARKWTSQYEWYAHRRLAIKEGLNPAIADDLAEGRRPAGMQADEAMVYELCTELHNSGGLSDATWEKGIKQFGEPGVVDLIAASGYYTMVAFILNVDKKALPEGEPIPLKPL